MKIPPPILSKWKSVVCIWLTTSMLGMCFPTVYAQVRVGINGNVSVGSTNIPTEHQTKFHVVGNSVFLGNNTYPQSAAYIRGVSYYTSPNEPEYTWYNDGGTGFFHPENGVIGLTIWGSEKLRVHKDKWIYEKQDTITYGQPRDYYGFVAQEVEQKIPSSTLVKNMADGTKALQYHSLIPFVVEAIKEQNTIVTNLQLTLDSVRTKLNHKSHKLNDLQDRVDSLEARLIQCCKKKNGNGNANKTAPTDNCETCDLLQSKAELFQNRPNPFSKESIIEYYLPENQTGKMMLFDMTGKLIKSINLSKSGQGNVVIQANELGAGMYIYSLIVNDQEIDSKRMIITD